MPVHVPGPELYNSIPFRHLGGKGKQGKKGVFAALNLTAFVDMMTMLVVFLLMTFSASGEILMSQKGLDLPLLQPDKSVDAKVLNRVMKTAYAAEYPNIMFAIAQRSGGH